MALWLSACVLFHVGSASHGAYFARPGGAGGRTQGGGSLNGSCQRCPGMSQSRCMSPAARIRLGSRQSTCCWKQKQETRSRLVSTRRASRHPGCNLTLKRPRASPQVVPDSSRLGDRHSVAPKSVFSPRFDLECVKQSMHWSMCRVRFLSSHTIGYL